MARAKKVQPDAGAFDISSGTVRIGERTYTVGRALAEGLIVRGVEGGAVLTDLALQMQDTQGQKAVQREARARDWRRRQGIEEPETTSDGRLVRRRQPEPLRPKNVTPEGEPVEDDATLAQIADRTAAIEKAHLAELESADG